MYESVHTNHLSQRAALLSKTAGDPRGPVLKATGRRYAWSGADALAPRPQAATEDTIKKR
eukprot:4100869-Pyramimonas_sp.AAC.1